MGIVKDYRRNLLKKILIQFRIIVTILYVITRIKRIYSISKTTANQCPLGSAIEATILPGQLLNRIAVPAKVRGSMAK